MNITQEQLFAIQEGLSLTNDEEEFEYNYEETGERSYKWSTYTEFVFFLEGKWYQGEYESRYEDGISDDDIECIEVEPHEVKSIEWRKVK